MRNDIVAVLNGLENQVLHDLVEKILTPVLDQLGVPESRRLRARRPEYPDIVVPVRWLSCGVHEIALVYVRGLTSGRENFLGIDLQGLLTALRVYGDEQRYVKVKEMPVTCDLQEPCFIIPDGVLRKWGLVRMRGNLPGLAELVANEARKARAGA